MKALLLCAALAWPVSASDMPHVQPKIRAGRVVAGSAIVLPAHVSLVRLGVKGAEGMEDQASATGGRLFDAVGRELTARGMNVLPNPAEGADDAAKYRIADLQNKFDHLRVPMSRRPGRVGKGGYTLGDAVATFQPGRSSVMVFIRGAGQVKTGGAKALATVVLNPLMAWSQFRGDLSFVDSASGEVIAFVRFSILKDLANSTDDQLREVVRQTLRPVPLPIPWK